MQILAVLRRRTEAFADADFAPLLDDEAEALRRLYAEGIVRAAWSRGDTPGACLMLEADSEYAARTALARLPLVAKEMIEAQLIPLRGYRGFGPRA
ncbi:MAG: hypothetical protein KGN02_03970 [bacterium]|nr:hypothetical protein [bacterium]